MKNKSGFTLVELIAVIALLAVIMTIAGISIVNIKENTLKGERENLRTTIKIAAREYHEETGVEIVPVLVLIQTGRIEADEFDSSGDPVIYDPYDKKVINCECVNFKESDEGKWDSKTDCCDPAIIANEVNINYIYSDEGTTAKAYTYVEEDKWFAMGNGQTLQFIGAIDKVDDVPVEYTWINPSAPDFAVEGLTFDVELPELGYINSAYTVNANFSGYYASKTFGIKVDGKKPILENYYIENMETWSPNKTLHADFKDGESGIYGYYLNYSDGGCSKNKSSYKTTDGAGNTITGTNDFTLNETIDKNGTLSICLMDNAGNFVESSEKVLVTHIDNTAPELEVVVVNGTIYSKSNSVSVTLKDGIPEDESQKVSGVSGLTSPSYTVKYKWSTSSVSCSDISSSNTITLTDTDGDGVYTGSKTISSGTGNGKIYVCPNGSVADQAGNTVANTPVSENMYLDNTAPTCGTKTNSSTTWTKTNKTVSVACADASGTSNQSGCVKTSYSKDYSSNTKTDTIQIADKAGNTTNCSVDVYLDKTAPTCGSTTNSTTTWSKSNKTVSVACNDSFGECSNPSFSTTYSTTTKTSSIQISDKAGNTATCNVNVYLDKDAPVCGTVTGQSTTWTNSNRTISVACSDHNSTNSGCTNSSFSNTYSTSTKTSSIQIKDNAGNTTDCPVNVYVDKTAPTISSVTVSSTTANYNGATVNVKLNSLADAHSGVSAVCLTTTNSSSGCSWTSTTGSSYTYSNRSTGLSVGSGNSITYYAFVKDAVGNVSSSASRTYYVYEYCDEYTTTYGSWGSCDGGYRERSIKYKDYYFSSISCGSDTDWESCCDSSYSDDIYDYRYYGCDEIYVYYCQPTCNSGAQCYTDQGYVYRSNLKGSQPSGCNTVDLCDYTDDSSPLFGKYKGDISGNYGTWYGSLSFSYHCYNGAGCERSNGYDRKCATDLCGAYKGYTAKQLSSALGCKFSTYWCSCSHSGSF